MDSCEYIKTINQLYTIPEFAALWCGVPEKRLDEVLSKAEAASESAQGDKY